MHDLGVDVPPARYVATVRETEADIVGLSCLLTTTRPMMGEVVLALDAAGVRQAVKVLAGGAPITEEFAGAIGADAYAPDARAAAGIALVLAGS